MNISDKFIIGNFVQIKDELTNLQEQFEDKDKRVKLIVSAGHRDLWLEDMADVSKRLTMLTAYAHTHLVLAEPT